MENKTENLEDLEKYLKKSIPILDKFEIAGILNKLTDLIQTIRKEAIESVLPEKEANLSSMEEEYIDYYADGFNDCRDEIIQLAREKCGVEIE